MVFLDSFPDFDDILYTGDADVASENFLIILTKNYKSF